MKFFILSSLLFAASFADSGEEDSAAVKGRYFGCQRKPSNRNCPTCGDCGKNYLLKMDFYHVRPVLSGPGQTFDSTTFGLDDGTLTTSCHGGFINSNPFTQYLLSPVRYADHLKYFMAALAPAEVPRNGDLVLEFDGSATVYNTDQSPYPKDIVQINDFRLGYGFFTAIDPVNFLVFAFFLTNDRIYACYSRFPLDRASTYAKFDYVVPVAMRKACDCHDMKIVFHGDKKQVSWRLEGKEVFRVLKPGYLIGREYMVMDEGGVEEAAWPQAVVYGVGTGDSLDSYPTCKRSDTCCDCQYPMLHMALANTGTDPTILPQYNPMLGPTTPAIYWKTTYADAADETAYLAWGQGATVTLNKLIVYQDFCAGRRC